MMAAQPPPGGDAPDSRVESGEPEGMELEHVYQDSHAISSDVEEGEVHSEEESHAPTIDLQGLASSIAEVVNGGAGPGGSTRNRARRSTRVGEGSCSEQC